MAEYISREAMVKNLIADLERHSGEGDPRTHLIMRRFVKYVKDFPAADVQPVVHAHWRRGGEKGFRTYNPLWYCSNCGGQIRYDTRLRQYQKIKCPVWEVNAFCRKCGARMDGDAE